jgi:hypothetical protein
VVGTFPISFLLGKTTGECAGEVCGDARFLSDYKFHVAAKMGPWRGKVKGLGGKCKFSPYLLREKARRARPISLFWERIYGWGKIMAKKPLK